LYEPLFNPVKLKDRRAI